jgi:integrase
VRGYRSIMDAHLLPAFGERALEQLTAREIERWRDELCPAGNVERLSNNTRNRILTLLHGVLARACRQYGIAINPASSVERRPVRSSHEIEVLSPEEVHALVRAAASAQDGAIYLTAAFTGLRMGELIALRWRDIDTPAQTIRVRASYSAGALTTPKSGKVRAVPLAPDVAKALDGLRSRGYLLGDDDLVFLGDTGSYLDGSALRRR